jgi:hypothetical protein
MPAVNLGRVSEMPTGRMILLQIWRITSKFLEGSVLRPSYSLKSLGELGTVLKFSSLKRCHDIGIKATLSLWYREHSIKGSILGRVAHSSPILA